MHRPVGARRVACQELHRDAPRVLCRDETRREEDGSRRSVEQDAPERIASIKERLKEEIRAICGDKEKLDT